MASVGIHCLLELYGCPVELLDDEGHITRTLREAAEYAGATWLNECHHRFDPCGVTAMGLLAESHISIHTWPEVGYAAVDVFTCGDAAMPERACEYIVKHMRAERKTLARIPRAAALTPREVKDVDPHDAHMTTRVLDHKVLDAN